MVLSHLSPLSSTADPKLVVSVLDQPGQGGACHNYEIKVPNTDPMSSPHTTTTINFQNGPIKEVGLNGLTHEALLVILIHRLAAFQNGPFACDENAIALESCETALRALHLRTDDRIKRQVEGKNIK